MIRRKVFAEPAIYYTEDIARSPMSEYYDQIDLVIGDWESLARPLAGAFSRRMGRPTDHILYLKIFLIGFFQGVVDDTRLSAICSDSIAIRRFLGLTLTESVPDHSSISRVRDECSEHCNVIEVLETLVQRCVAAGLVSGHSAHVDTTLVKANASLKAMCSLDTGQSVGDHFKEARENGRKQTLKNSEFYSPADPESRVRQKGADKAALCYMGVHVTDSKHQVILSARMTYGDSAEVEASLPSVFHAQETLAGLGKPMDVVCADKGYDSVEFHNKLEQAGLRPATFYQKEKREEGRFSRSDFKFDTQNNLYRCPAGKELRFARLKQGSSAYLSMQADCSGCPLRGQCLGPKSVRKELSRSPGEDASERNRAFVSTPQGRAHLKKRSYTVEPPFGHIKGYGGLERLNCRGLAKANFKFVMAAVGWNIKKLLKETTGRASPRASAPDLQTLHEALDPAQNMPQSTNAEAGGPGNASWKGPKTQFSRQSSLGWSAT